ncbi:MAG: hypothetical protein V4557_06605 [Bacteroidota bacterium]
MKKIALFSLTGIMICLFYWGCKKNSNTLNDANSKLIEEAKYFFTSQIIANSVVLNAEEGKHLGFRQMLKKTPMWDNAIADKMSMGDGLIIPIKLDSVFYSISNFGGQKQSLENRIKLFMYKDIQGKFKTELVSSFPDQDFVIGKSQKFTGIILVEDWNGNFIKGYKYEKNKILRLKSYPTSSGSPTPKINYIQAPNTTCFYDDYFRCVVGTDNCILLYTEFMGCIDNYDGSIVIPGGAGGPIAEDYQRIYSPHIVPKTQDELDKEWQDQNVRDSTKNPCAKKVLDSLSAIQNKLPTVIRNFFSADADFSMTVKMDTNATWGMNGRAPDGAFTKTNITSSNFEVFINSYYANSTDLGMAATIIHEAFHCQLMNWYREAIVNNDQPRREQLAADYGYLFPPDFNTDSSLNYIVNGGNATQHQDMINRYQQVISTALYQFALANNISVDLNYCKDLSWTGTFDSKAFRSLSSSTQDRIRERVYAEKDPYAVLTDQTGNYSINTNSITPKGKPCN